MTVEIKNTKTSRNYRPLDRTPGGLARTAAR